MIAKISKKPYDGPILFEVGNKPDTERITPKILVDNWYGLIED